MANKLSVVDYLLPGQANAIPARQLADLMGIRSTRYLRNLVERERRNGAVILSSTDDLYNGYYLPGSPEEVDRYIAQQSKICDNRISQWGRNGELTYENVCAIIKVPIVYHIWLIFAHGSPFSWTGSFALWRYSWIRKHSFTHFGTDTTRSMQRMIWYRLCCNDPRHHPHETIIPKSGQVMLWWTKCQCMLISLTQPEHG